MKLIVVLGSTRENSVSKKVAEKIIEGAKPKYSEVVVYYENDMNVKCCRGCGSCRKNGTDCIIEDDLKKYFQDLHTCDALILTAPNYYSQVSGNMITFMNRHYCLNNPDKTSRLTNKVKLVGIFSQGAPTDYPKYVPNYDWYLSTFTSKGMELVTKMIIGGDMDTSENSEIMKKALEVGKNL